MVAATHEVQLGGGERGWDGEVGYRRFLLLRGCRHRRWRLCGQLCRVYGGLHGRLRVIKCVDNSGVDASGTWV